MVLLLWTAADLSNVSLCALDNEGALGAGTFGGSTVFEDGSTNQLPLEPSAHIDDCFCCSHCVDIQALAPATVVIPAALKRTPFILAAPRLFGSSVYHPPLAQLQ